MGRALAHVRSEPSALTLPQTYYVTQDKSLNLSRPHFILKTKFCLSAQTTFAIPSGSTYILLFFKPMFSFLLFFSFINSVSYFCPHFELLLFHFDVKTRKVYDNLDSLGLLDFCKRKKV